MVIPIYLGSIVPYIQQITSVLVIAHVVPPGSLTQHLKRYYLRRKVVFNHHFYQGYVELHVCN